MNAALILAIIQQMVLPEVIDIINKRQAAGLPITLAAVQAELNERAAVVIGQGQAWLDAHKTTV